MKKNILNLNFIDKCSIIEKDVLNEFDFNTLESKFDIIFLDPPYKEKLLSTLLKKIFDANILNKEGIIIIHRHKNEIDETFGFLNILEKKVYGISKIIFGKFV